MEEYYQRRNMSLLALSAFPRSLGMLLGALYIAAIPDPDNAALLALGVWFMTFLLKTLLPLSIVDTNLWTCCLVPVQPMSLWIFKWPIFLLLVGIGIARGASLQDTAFSLGILLVWDMIIVATRGV